MCSDTRKRGGVITSGPKISYHCFNCNYTTGWTPSPHLGKKYKDLAEALGVDKNVIHNVTIELMKNSDEFEDIDVDNYVYNFKHFEKVELPDNVEMISTLDDSHELKVYAKEVNNKGMQGVRRHARKLGLSKQILKMSLN